MNFSFGYSQRKPFGFPLNMRQFSTATVVPPKMDSFMTKNSQFNMFTAPIISNKSFSNPNFVNKNHPKILAPSLAGIVKIDRPQNYCVQQQKCDIKHIKNDETTCIIMDKLPRESSQEESVTIVEKAMEEPKAEQSVENRQTSPKMSKRSKRKKRKQANKGHHNKTKSKKCGNGKKSKPWHKTNTDLEIMELSESALDSDSSNMFDEPEQPFCITITATPAIDIKPDSRILNLEKSDSSLSISPCHHEILKSLSCNLLKSNSLSPCSPTLRSLRMPSECESEDSFIVFEDQLTDDEELSPEEEDSDFEEATESDESDCDVEFSDNCDISSKKKKVSIVLLIKFI